MEHPHGKTGATSTEVGSSSGLACIIGAGRQLPVFFDRLDEGGFKKPSSGGDIAAVNVDSLDEYLNTTGVLAKSTSAAEDAEHEEAKWNFDAGIAGFSTWAASKETINTRNRSS
ncbi:hypothetical protein ERJ75_001844300 [Trypanosoma vivax]|nr:hypothetical protein ERJ75_001844300 [Trypanosoma vivax]